MTRVRDLIPGDEFFLGRENFTAEPTVGQYAVPTAGSNLWTPVATPTEGAVAIRIEYQREIVEGMVNNGVKYHCTVL